MRVLHVYRTYFPDTQGGLEETIRQICCNTKAFGVDSRVFMLSRNPDPAVIEMSEARVYRFPLSFEISSCGFSLHCFSGFKQLVDWADIVHYHFPWPFGDLLHLWSARDKPSVVTYHSDVIRQRHLLRCYRPVMQRFLASVDRIIATSPNYVETSPVLRNFSEKIEVIPIGLNYDSYPQVDASELDRVEQQFGRDFFLFVGVLRYYKGLHILLEAAQHQEFKIVIVGAGPIESELKAQAAELGLTNIVFPGFVSDQVKVALFRLARAVVFPSYLRSEAFGVTLVEGAMYRKPLISAEIDSGMSYINQHEETGLVVSPGDPVALRQAMLCLHNSPESAQIMGEAAHERYQQLFTGRKMGERYAALYQKMG